MRRLFTAAAFALASLSLQSAANAAEEAFPNITNPKQVIDSVDIDVLAEIVGQIGGGDIRKHTDKKQKGISFLDGDTPHNLIQAFCDVEPGKCFGVIMLVVVDNSKLNFTLDTLNQGNKDTSFLTFFREENNKFMVARVDLVEGGITRKNLGIKIGMFAIEYREAMKRLSSQLSAGLPGPFQRASYGYRQPIRALRVPLDVTARTVQQLEQDYRHLLPRRRR
jgi:hypothetical protein